MDEWKTCAFCGTQVKKQFEICRGCGAKHRESFGEIGFGLLVMIGCGAFLQSVFKEKFQFLNLETYKVPALLLVGVVVGFFIMKSGFKARWYRKDD